MILIPTEARAYLFCETSRPAHEAFYSVCTACTIPGVKQLGHGAHYLSTANARVRRRGSIPRVPLYAVMAYNGTTLLTLCGCFE